MSIKDEFLKKLKEIARSKNQKMDKAFIHWYINVAFGDVKYVVTDGPCDGGIDAIVRLGRVRGNKLIYVLQSKYTDSFFRKKQLLHWTPLIIQISIIYLCYLNQMRSLRIG